MKLATYKDGSRDGQLIVVSRDLTQAHYANGIATRLQQVLDDWGFLSPQLEDLSTQLNHGKLRHAFAFDPKLCLAPLPRAYRWIERDEEGASDDLLGPCAPARFGSEAMDIDFGAGLAVVTGDVAQGATPAQALDGVRLLMLTNAWRLGKLTGLHARPTTAFGPVAVSADELGAAWNGGRVELNLQTMWNGRKVANVETGAAASFGELIAHAAKTRPLRAGTIFGSGAIADEGDVPKADFMKFGDSLRIEMKGRDGQSVFGAIDQDVVSLADPIDKETTE